jgi:hypothetical protein
MTHIATKASVFSTAICLVSLICCGSRTAYAQGMFTDGAACEVTAGLNAGKVGVFTDGGAWCSGDWGATECVNNDHCKAR